jgi:hypothetical protein
MDPWQNGWRPRSHEHFHSETCDLDRNEKLRDPDQNIYRAHPKMITKGMVWLGHDKLWRKSKQRSVPAKNHRFFRELMKRSMPLHTVVGIISRVTNRDSLHNIWCLEYCRNGRPQLTYFELEAIDQVVLLSRRDGIQRKDYIGTKFLQNSKKRR